MSRWGIAYVFGFMVLAAGLLFGSQATDFFQEAWSSHTYEVALSDVVDCTRERNGPMCARPVVRKLLEMKSSVEIMDALSARLTALQCHYIGHVVGQQSYIKYQDIEVAISQCDRTCDSSCVHGVIGESFAEKLGFGTPDDTQDIDFAHLSPDEVRKVGKQLCASPATCHGVGHTLFQMYKKFEPALAMCREVALGQSLLYCYQAMFMEYADILYSRNMRPVPDVTAPALSDIESFCDYPTAEERRACFRYFPRVAILVFRRDGSAPEEAMQRFRSLCASYSDSDDRIGCTVGIGVYLSYSLMKDPAAAVEECRTFSNRVEQAACNLGQVSVATRDRQPKVIAYCAAVSDESLRADCYQHVFYFLNRLSVPKEEAKALCKGDSLCEEQTKNFLLEPGKLVRKYLSK